MVYAFDVRDLVGFDPSSGGIRLVGNDPVQRPIEISSAELLKHVDELARASPWWDERCSIEGDDQVLVVIGPEELLSLVEAFLAGGRMIDRSDLISAGEH